VNSGGELEMGGRREKQKPHKPIAIQYVEDDHVLYLLDEHVKALTSLASASACALVQRGLDELIYRLAEEPLSILLKSPFIMRSYLENLNYKKARDLKAIYGKLVVRSRYGDGGGVLALNTLEEASVNFLIELYALQPLNINAWSERRPQLAQTLYAFLYHRDAPEAERTRSGRRKGYEQAKWKLQEARKARMAEKATRDREIRAKATALRGQDVEPRTIVGRLSRIYHLSSSQVRRILSKK
jgi:hypothetical protein